MCIENPLLLLLLSLLLGGLSGWVGMRCCGALHTVHARIKAKSEEGRQAGIQAKCLVAREGLVTLSCVCKFCGDGRS